MATLHHFHIPIYHHHNPREVVSIQEEIAGVLPRYRERLAKAWDDTAMTSFSYEAEGRFLDDAPLLKQYVLSHVAAFTEDLRSPSRNIGLRSSWVNVSRKYGYQNYHSHTMSDLSGVYYYQTSGKDGLLKFRSDSTGLKNSYWSNYRDVEYEPKEGLLILFPSFLEHAVMMNQTDFERISISFNVRLHR